MPRFNVLEERLTGALPFPVSPTVWVPALSAMVRVPEAEPRAVGVNETWTVQEAPGAMLAVQLLVWLNGAAAVTLETCRGPVPVFCKTTLLAWLVVFSTWDWKDTVAGVTEAVGAVPKPERVTACAAPRLPESSVTVSNPLAGPATDGAKDTETVQLDPPGRVVGQLLVSVNPPFAEIFEKSSGLPPKLAMVRGRAPLVPTFWLKLKVAGAKLTAEGRGLGKGIEVTPKT